MTIIAGAISRDGAALPRRLRDALVLNLSRHSGDVAEVYGGDQWLLAAVDVGALGAKGSSCVAGGAAIVVAGDPLVSDPGGEGRKSHQADVEALFADMCSRSHTALQVSTGTYCAAYYSPKEHRLTLVSDKLGIRPIYYIVTPEFAAFTSALRVFEAAGLTTGGIDLRGTYQTCTFGFPLGTRTCYAGIRTIGAAELIHVTREAENHFHYFRWDTLTSAEHDENRLIEQLTSTFDRAVMKRLRGDKATLAFLSGGLDSRTIVAALRKHNVDLHTINFAIAGTQDRVFGGLAANSLGTKHHQLEVLASATENAHRQEHLQQWAASTATSLDGPERPRCIWSGDGGSVGLGHVYLDPKTVDCFEAGDLEGGIRAFLRYNGIDGSSNSAMTRVFQEQSRNWHIESVREEITAFDRTIDGRALHLFLMLNDQRRHMAKHFENIDLHRFEFHLPFFDSEFLEVILSAPIRPFLRHALYHKWVQTLSPAAASVPWQTYPNHEPCPVPFKEQLRYQFVDYYDKPEQRRLARKQGREALSRLFTRPFPDHLICRPRYAAAILSCLSGSNAYGHVARVGETFARVWQQSHQHAFRRVAPTDLQA